MKRLLATLQESVQDAVHTAVREAVQEGAPPALLTGALAVLLMITALLTLSGCQMMTRISDGELRKAAASGAAGELERMGYRPDRSLVCKTPPSNTASVVRVECEGRTVRGERIRLSGVARDANTTRPREWYVISVDGRNVLNKQCLGEGCTQLAGRR